MVVLLLDLDLVNSRPKLVRATAYSGREEENASQHAQSSTLDGRLHEPVSDTEEVIREFREFARIEFELFVLLPPLIRVNSRNSRIE